MKVRAMTEQPFQEAASKPNYAPLSQRLWGMAIDGILLNVAIYALVVLLAAVFPGSLGTYGFVGSVWVLWIGCIFLYHPLMEVKLGGSVGKLLTGMRVVQVDTIAAVTFRQGVIRSLSWIVDGLLVFPVIAGVVAYRSPRNQRLGDRWANTVVIKVR